MHRSRILVADDNDTVRSFLIRLIQESDDMEIIGEASDGSAAVEMTKQLMPNMIIMDVNMPVMDGIEATHAIHSEFPEIAVIGFSIFDESDTGQAMLDAGAVSCFSKNVPCDSFLSGIREVLARSSRSVHHMV